MTTPSFDLRPLPPPQRPSSALERLTSLHPGATLELLGDLDPRPLLAHLQREHADRFDWYFLEDGPDTWRVEIVRLEELDSERPTAALVRDHERLERLLEEIGRGNRSAVRPYVTGLRHHVRAEEEVLFPAFLAAGGPAGPIRAMRAEHDELLELLPLLPDAAALERLRVVVGAHDAREEQVLYRLCDRLLAGRGGELRRRMQAV